MKKEYRVKKNEDFSRIIKRKQSMANRTFIIYYLKNDIGHARIGISVSKKLGKAVIRNKIKRQVRMIIKETINLDDNYDYIVIVRNKFLDLDFISNLKEFNYLYKKILKVFCLVFFIAILTGCTANLDKNGNLIDSRAITMSTPWSLSAGWFDFLFVIPIAKGILFINQYVGNVAIGVIGVTIVVNLITLPIMVKSTVSTQKIQLLQPEMEKIQNKYRGRKDQASQMRQNAEIQNLYKKHNVSMFGSFATFLTLPIMIAMWQAVQRIDILYKTSLFGINLGEKPISHIMEFSIEYIVLLLLVAVTQYFAVQISQIMAKRSPRYRPSQQMQTMNTMNNVMTLFIVYLAATMPAAMSLYWITTNIIGIVRTVYIQFFHIEKVKKEVSK